MKKQQEQTGDRVRRLREHYGISQSELAKLAGLKSYQAIWGIEAGKTKPLSATIQNIANTLGSTVEWLLHGEGEMLPGGMVQFNQTKEAHPPVESLYQDTLYKELREQIDFYRQLLMQVTGGKAASFLQALNGTGLRKRGSLGAAA